MVLFLFLVALVSCSSLSAEQLLGASLPATLVPWIVSSPTRQGAPRQMLFIGEGGEKKEASARGHLVSDMALPGRAVSPSRFGETFDASLALAEMLRKTTPQPDVIVFPSPELAYMTVEAKRAGE